MLGKSAGDEEQKKNHGTEKKYPSLSCVRKNSVVPRCKAICEEEIFCKYEFESGTI